MTVHQGGTGHTADYGIVGFEKGVTGQILVFPKSIKAYAGLRIVGVKYELLNEDPVSRSQRDNRPTKRSKPGSDPNPQNPKPAPKPVPLEKIVYFPLPDPVEGEEDAAELKKGIHRAIWLLEQGKGEAALRVLNGLVR